MKMEREGKMNGRRVKIRIRTGWFSKMLLFSMDGLEGFRRVELSGTWLTCRSPRILLLKVNEQRRRLLSRWEYQKRGGRTERAKYIRFRTPAFPKFCSLQLFKDPLFVCVFFHHCCLHAWLFFLLIVTRSNFCSFARKFCCSCCNNYYQRNLPLSHSRSLQARHTHNNDNNNITQPGLPFVLSSVSPRTFRNNCFCNKKRSNNCNSLENVKVHYTATNWQTDKHTDHQRLDPSRSVTWLYKIQNNDSKSAPSFRRVLEQLQLPHFEFQDASQLLMNHPVPLCPEPLEQVATLIKEKHRIQSTAFSWGSAHRGCLEKATCLKAAVFELSFL